MTSGGLVGTDTFTGALSRVAGENVGFYAIQQGTLAINDGNGGANYTLTFVDGELEITPLAIEVTANDQTKTYGDADPALTWTVTSGGLVGTDTFTGALSRVAGENVGFYAIQQGTLAINDGNGGANYTLTFVDGELEITPLAIEVTANDQTKTYGDADPALTWTVTSGGLVGTDTFTGALSRVAGENVGFYAIQQGTLAINDGNGGANYTLTFVDGELEITPLAIEVTANDQTKTYGDADPALTWTVTSGGLVGTDTFTGALSRVAGENVGFYAIQQGTLAINDGNGGANYTLTFVDGELEITPLAIEVTANDQTKIYGDADPALTWTVTSGGLVGTDTFTGALSRVAGENVGFYAIQQGTLAINDGNGGANYTLTFVDGELEITPKALTITGIIGIDKVYDGTTNATVDASAAVLNGVVGSDNVSVDLLGATASFANKHVGTGKTITITGLILTGADAGNYYLVDPTTTADITPLAIEVTSDNTGKTYGDADPVFTWTITNGALVGGDTIIGTMTRDAGENVGFYNILQGTVVVNDGNGGLNYILTFVSSGQLEITPRAIEVTADNAVKTYGDPDPLFTWTITNGALVGSDTIVGTMTRDAGENVGFYSILQGTLVVNDGNSGLNYILTFVSSGQLEITPRAIRLPRMTGARSTAMPIRP